MIKTDAASKVGVAGILLQLQGGEWKIISCCSRRLSKSELNYPITDVEGLAVIYTVNKFRPYLLGKHSNILVDHCALCVLNSRTPISPRLKRWAIVLSEFDFEIKYTAGNLHNDVDCLSRAPVDNETDEFLENRVYAIVRPVDIDNWKDLYTDEDATELAKKDYNLSSKEEVLYKDNKLYVPVSRRRELMEEAHNNNGHGGQLVTLRKLDDYWWPTLREDLIKYIDCCEECQFRKVERTKTPGSIQHFNIYEPADTVGIDVLGEMTATLETGNKFVIVAIDYFTRFIDAKAVQNIQAATIRTFLEEHIGKFGTMRRLLSDHGPEFKNNTVKELCVMRKIEQMFSTPGHSEGNAIVERAIAVIQEKLSITGISRDMQNHWDIILPSVILAINTSYHKSTGYTPFELQFGRKAPALRLAGVTNRTSPHDLYNQLVRHQLEQMQIHAVNNQGDAHAAHRDSFEKTHQMRSFEVDDLVLSRLKARKGQAKIGNRYDGP